MDSTTSKASPFPPASDVPLHRNPPLAPSQEMAYRNKCIQLKRRLTEIESNNDATRKRIATEKERVQKMRLLRVILLNQIRDIMDTPGTKLTPEQLQRLGIVEKHDTEDYKLQQEGDTMLDDDSDESEDEEIPEPSERPTRTRRANNNARESIMNTNNANTFTTTNTTGAYTPGAYQTTGLPHLAPANSYSPVAPREPAAATTSSFHAASTPFAAASPSSSQYNIAQPAWSDRRYQQQSSPLQQHPQPATATHHDPVRNSSVPRQESNGTGQSPPDPPVVPKQPYEQFVDHMRPQLEADDYPPQLISNRISEEWHKLSHENRELWEQRYDEQYAEYQQQVEAYARSMGSTPSGIGQAMAHNGTTGR